MLTRILTALVGIPLAVCLVFYPNGLPFTVAVGIVSLLGAREFYRAARRANLRPVEWAGLLAVVLLAVSARTYVRGSIGSLFPAIVTLLLIFSFVTEMIRKERAPVVNVGVTVLGAVYVGWLISHLVAMRQLPGEVVVAPYRLELGAVFVMYTFLCTWACDTFAYFVGRYLGKKKLAPNLSPNKTVEGALGGLLGAIAMAVGLSFVIGLPIYHGLALGVLFGILSQMGDLSESAIKRELVIKDSGNIVPGHGGILDRFDSLLFSGPIAYYYIILFLQNWPN